MKTSIRRISTLAASAAALALSATTLAADPPAGSKGRAIASNDGIHCYGLHECKGQADCATTEHDCKGMNECAGHGFKALSAGECLTRGGTIGDIG